MSRMCKNWSEAQYKYVNSREIFFSEMIQIKGLEKDILLRVTAVVSVSSVRSQHKPILIC